MKGGKDICRLGPMANLPSDFDYPAVDEGRFNSEVQQQCIDDMTEYRGWRKGREQGRKSPVAMRA
jgi:hypothetical protein